MFLVAALLTVHAHNGTRCPDALAKAAKDWSRTLRSARTSAASKTLVRNRLLSSFWGEGPHLERLLHELARRGFAYSTCIDIGAGAYGSAESGDQPLMLRFAQTFPGTPEAATRVIGFEPDPRNPVHERARNSSTPNTKLITLTKVVTAQPGKVRLYGSQNGATTNLRLLAHPHYYPRGHEQYLEATSIDEVLREHSLDGVDVLKTDTEGCELEVLQGASAALRAQRVRVLLIAYEDKWSGSTYFAAYPSHKSHAFQIAPNVSAMQLPSLHSVTRHLDSLGYESFLLGSAGSVAGVQFIPLSGNCWDDVFELGRDPHALGLKYTWFDFVAVVRGSAESVAIRSIIGHQQAASVGADADRDTSRTQAANPATQVSWRIVTIASIEFSNELTHAVRTFAGAGHVASALVVGCLDQTCHALCAALPTCEAREVPPLHTRKLAIGLFKFGIVNEFLVAGHFVFNFDLDVFFFAHPIHSAFLVQPLLTGADVVAQDDDVKRKSFRHPNFGLFAVAPTSRSVLAFSRMLTLFNQSCSPSSQSTLPCFGKDQSYFQHVLNHKDHTSNSSMERIRTHYLPKSLYVNFMNLDVKDLPHDAHAQTWNGTAAPRTLPIAVHMTCVEGTHTKRFVLKQFFGWTDEDGYFSRPRQTLTLWAGRGQTLGKLSSASIRLLVHAAHALNRSIRIQEMAQDMTLSPDKLALQSVQLMERGYWEGVQRALPSRRFTDAVLSTQDLLDLLQPELRPPASRMLEIDEIQVQFNDSQLESWIEKVRTLGGKKHGHGYATAIEKLACQHSRLVLGAGFTSAIAHPCRGTTCLRPCCFWCDGGCL